LPGNDSGPPACPERSRRGAAPRETSTPVVGARCLQFCRDRNTATANRQKSESETHPLFFAPWRETYLLSELSSRDWLKTAHSTHGTRLEWIVVTSTHADAMRARAMVKAIRRLTQKNTERSVTWRTAILHSFSVYFCVLLWMNRHCERSETMRCKPIHHNDTTATKASTTRHLTGLIRITLNHGLHGWHGSARNSIQLSVQSVSSVVAQVGRLNLRGLRTQNCPYGTQGGRSSDAKCHVVSSPQVVSPTRVRVPYQKLRTVRTQIPGTLNSG